jgi:hypothetical protein
MRRLLNYAIVLAFAVAIGVYLVFGSPSNEDSVPDSPQREAATSLFEPPPPSDAATPVSIDEEMDYMVARRLASLEGWRAFLAAHPDGGYTRSARAEIARRLGANGDLEEASAAAPLAPTDNSENGKLSQRLAALTTYLQSASARVEHLLLGEKKAPEPANSNVLGSVSTDATATSEPTDLTSSLSKGSVRPKDATVSHDALQDAKPPDDTARPSAPPAGVDGAAGTQLAALTPEGVCQRDEDRLAQLRNSSSLDEVVRFADDLGCEKLRPQILSLMERLAPPPAAADISRFASPGAKAEDKTAPPASPLPGAEVASLASEETCKRDEERLAQLGSNPSRDEALRFVKELGCEKLLPQLQRLLGNRDFDASAPRQPANSDHSDSDHSDSDRSNLLLGQTCASERAALDRLRQVPSAEAAGLFSRDMQCEGLRPQVRLLLESLNVTPDSAGSATSPGEPETRGVTSDTSGPSGKDTAACHTEAAELNRIRAAPDLGDAKRFASTVTCGALRPQVARLLESFGE